MSRSEVERRANGCSLEGPSANKQCGSELALLALSSERRGMSPSAKAAPLTDMRVRMRASSAVTR